MTLALVETKRYGKIELPVFVERDSVSNKAGKRYYSMGPFIASHEVIDRWLQEDRRTKFKLDQITDPAVLYTVIMMLENQNLVLNGSIKDQGIPVYEEIVSGQAAGFPPGSNLQPFAHYLLPIVRRVYANLIAYDIVGVHPMTSPQSIVYYLKYRYTGLARNDTTPRIRIPKGGTRPGTEYAQFIGNTWNIDPYYSLQVVFDEQLTSKDWDLDINTYDSYKAIPQLNGTVSFASGSSPAQTLAYPVLTNAPIHVRFNFVLDYQDASNNSLGVHTVTIAGTISAPIQNLSPGQYVEVPFAIVSSTDPTISFATGNLIRIRTIITATGAVQFEFVGGGSFSGFSTQVPSFDHFVVQNTSNVSLIYEYSQESNRLLPEIEFFITQSPVTAERRSLRYAYSLEVAQDARMMHNIDVESELLAVAGNHMIAEIDREILLKLMMNAATRVNYDYSSPFIVGGRAVVPNAPSGSTVFALPGALNFNDRNRALMAQAMEVSYQIHRQTLRGAGNKWITSPEIASKLSSLLEFVPSPESTYRHELTITKVGTINGIVDIYVDPLFPKDSILVAYRGASFWDTGFYFCPYVPIQATPTIPDPETGSPRRIILSRYGTVMIENGERFYGLIRVQNLTAIGADVLPGSNSPTFTPQISGYTMISPSTNLGSTGKL